MVRLLRSPAFARATLVYLASYAAIGAWLPWTRPGGSPAPGWARAAWLDAPFSSPLFLAGCAALFASTFACTWGRAARIRATWRGDLLPGAIELAPRPAVQLEPFLRQNGFRGAGPVRRRFVAGLWGGWLLHVGLLVLMAGVLVQQALHDGANFELAPGEKLRLDEPGAAFQRAQGVLAPNAPPPLEVALDRFDPHLHQDGYAPDRLSRISARREGASGSSAVIDRAQGLKVGDVTIHQALPTGLALLIALPDGGAPRLIHLHGRDRTVEATIRDPGGRPMRFIATAERSLGDPSGTGALRVEVESAGGSRQVNPGESFAMSSGQAKLLELTWWGGFTYSRSPGMPAVLAGFGLILLGCVLLLLPAGVARLAGEGEPARVFLLRGADALRADWERLLDDPAGTSTRKG